MNRKVNPFIGNSNFTRELKELVHTLSQGSASVLLVGERGTGKRLFAQHLHSDVSDDFEYFFEVNCKSFNEQHIMHIFDSINQIAGYNYRITLYVSFVDELSKELQKAFLNLIDSSFKKGLSLKLVCSVESPLDSKVSSGLFSIKLYYKLNAIVLNMLPLSHRKDDILPISEFYLEKFRKKSGIKFEGFSDNAKKIITEYSWHGNIDELINSIQKAFIIGTPPLISSSDLGIFVLPSVSVDGALSYEDKSLRTAVCSFKKEYITKILEENGWNQTKTAKILGIQRTYVIRLMNELQIRRK